MTPLRTPDATRPTSSGDGVVSFCDWSHGHCQQGVSRSASVRSPRAFPVPVVSADQSAARRVRLKQWRGGGRDGLGGGHLHHGRTTSGSATPAPVATSGGRFDGSRMFLRQKTAATKGEKQIMMGICQNRGDLSRNPVPDCADCLIASNGLVSHQDAWAFGKTRCVQPVFPPVHNGRFSRLDTLQSPRYPYAEQRTPSKKGQTSPMDSCLVCTKPIQSESEPVNSVRLRDSHNSNGKIPPHSTPMPTTPTPQDNTGLELKPKSTPKSISSKPIKQIKPKLLLNVHLPRVPSSTSRAPAQEDAESDMPVDSLDQLGVSSHSFREHGRESR